MASCYEFLQFLGYDRLGVRTCIDCILFDLQERQGTPNGRKYGKEGFAYD